MPVVTENKLTTPPVVRRYLDAAADEPESTPEWLIEAERALNLSYHHGGKYMWARGHGAEQEVLFVGTGDEAADWMEAQHPDLVATISLDYIPTWKRVKLELGLSD
jgi:hypothetical protein